MFEHFKHPLSAPKGGEGEDHPQPSSGQGKKAFPSC